MASSRIVSRVTRAAAPAVSVQAGCTSRLAIQRSRWHASPQTRLRQLIPQFQSRCITSRNQNQDVKPSQIYDFTKVKELSSSTADAKPVLIDVREPHEFNAGHIPGAVNLPIQSQPDSLFLNEEEFEDRFGVAKPKVSEEVVFYCKAGVRSKAAAQFARQNGYEHVAEYPGSWMDWVKNGGEEVKP